MTAAELLALPPEPPGIDQWLFEGELVERCNPNQFHSPAHGGVTATLSAILGNWAKSQRPAGYRAFGYGCTYRLTTNPDTVVTYDASIARLTAPIGIDDPWVEGPPVLAIEAIELEEDYPTVDRLVAVSLAAGVKAVWVIDPFEEIVTVHRPGRRPRPVRRAMELSAGDVCPGLRCKVAEIFE